MYVFFKALSKICFLYHLLAQPTLLKGTCVYLTLSINKVTGVLAPIVLENVDYLGLYYHITILKLCEVRTKLYGEKDLYNYNSLKSIEITNLQVMMD